MSAISSSGIHRPDSIQECDSSSNERLEVNTSDSPSPKLESLPPLTDSTSRPLQDPYGPFSDYSSPPPQYSGDSGGNNEPPQGNRQSMSSASGDSTSHRPRDSYGSPNNHRPPFQQNSGDSEGYNGPPQGNWKSMNTDDIPPPISLGSSTSRHPRGSPNGPRPLPRQNSGGSRWKSVNTSDNPSLSGISTLPSGNSLTRPSLRSPDIYGPPNNYWPSPQQNWDAMPCVGGGVSISRRPRDSYRSLNIYRPPPQQNSDDSGGCSRPPQSSKGYEVPRGEGGQNGGRHNNDSAWESIRRYLSGVCRRVEMNLTDTKSRHQWKRGAGRDRDHNAGFGDDFVDDGVL